MQRDKREDHGKDLVDGLRLEVLEQGLEVARERRRELQLRIASLERDMRAVEQEERLLSELVTVRREGAIEGHPGSSGALESNKDQPFSHPVVGSVIAILEQERRPVHISEVMRQLRASQVEIPGAGTQANVISHLRRDDRIDRPSRGMYALKSWGVRKEAPSSKRRPRRWKKVVTKGQPPN